MNGVKKEYLRITLPPNLCLTFFGQCNSTYNASLCFKDLLSGYTIFFLSFPEAMLSYGFNEFLWSRVN